MSNLAGLCRGRNGRLYAFAVLVQGGDTAKARRAQDRVARALAARALKGSRTPGRTGSLRPSMPQIRFPGEPPELRRARQLRERVDTLNDARQRILAAADAERRRIERDLHDGAQQRLVSVCVTLGLAQAQIAENPEGAATLVAQAREEAQLAVQELRELARGIHPAILSDRGLGPALQALASRAPVPVEIIGVPDAPLDASLETAAYYVTAEALTNIAKHARAESARIELAVIDGCLRLCVRDDGVGGANPDGTGLHGLRDRVDALDGTLDIASPPGGGTAVTVDLPLRAPATAN